MLCPCGCGKKISRLNTVKQGAAGLLAVLDLVLPVFTDAVKHLTASETTTLDEDERVDLWRFIHRSDQLRSYLLDHCHGTATPSTTPDLVACKGMLDEYMQVGFTLMDGAGIEPPDSWNRG